LFRCRFCPKLKETEVHFTPDQEAELSQIARHQSTDAERLVMNAALRLLQEEARFRAAVREGIAQADRGEFVEEAEMDARFEEIVSLKRSPEEIRAWLDSLAEFTDQIPAFNGETFSRAVIYQDHD